MNGVYGRRIGSRRQNDGETAGVVGQGLGVKSEGQGTFPSPVDVLHVRTRT